MERRKWNTDENQERNPPADEQEAEDYLSKLAQSILSKEKRVERPASKPAANPATRGNSKPQTATKESPAQGRATVQTERAPQPHRHDAAKDWVRQVTMQDDNGNFLPGTILVFEDGSIGVYKESNRQKDYDIVYQLAETGRAVPQGIPLYNYEIEAIGRVSARCLEQIVTQNRWERDMIVFHLLKYRDIVYIPKVEPGNDTRRNSSSVVPKPPEMTTAGKNTAPVDAAPEATSPPPKTNNNNGELTRGRRLTIDFGPGRTWEAVYWGKDELGHVVAHHTHDHWALMHLDLGRFKESIAQGDIASSETLADIEKDFAKA